MQQTRKILFPDDHDSKLDTALASITESRNLCSNLAIPIEPLVPNELRCEMQNLRFALGLQTNAVTDNINSLAPDANTDISSSETSRNGGALSSYPISPDGGGTSLGCGGTSSHAKLLPVGQRGMSTGSAKVPRPHSQSKTSGGKKARSKTPSLSRGSDGKHKAT